MRLDLKGYLMSLFHDMLSRYVIKPCIPIAKLFLPFSAYKSVRYAMIYTCYFKKVFNKGFVIKKQKDGVCVCGNGINIFGLNENIIMHVNNIMIDDCYHFDIFNNEKWSVLDIGMNMGVASLYFAQNPNITTIYSYEPFTPTYNLGMKNLELNLDLAKKIIPYNYGLSDKYSVLELPYDIEISGCCSSIPEKQNKFIGKNKSTMERIRTVSAADELKRILNTDKNNIMLKIDCEGAEREIINDLYKNKLLSSVHAIAMEYHDGIYKPLIEMIKESGFSVSYKASNINYSTGMIYAHNVKHR